MVTSSEQNAGVVPLDEERRRRQTVGSNGVAALEGLDELGTAGAMLAAAREAKGFSLEHCADISNISVAKLAAIEAMDIGALPSASFALGFVRTYSEILGLPPEPVVKRFRTEARYPDQNHVPVIHSRVQRDLGPPQQASLFAVLLVIVFLAYVGWQVLQAVAYERPVAPPNGFPLALGPKVAAPSVDETESSVGDIANKPVATGRGPTGNLRTEGNKDTNSSTGGEVAQAENALSEIEQLQRGIEPESPMVPVRGPKAPTLKPTSEDRARKSAQRRAAALRVARAAAAAAEAEAAEAELEALAQASMEPALPEPDGTSAPPIEGSAALAGDTPALAAEITPPVRLSVVDPIYPTRCEAGAAAEEAVTIAYQVSPVGKVVGSTVSASTNDCFNRAALEAVARWGFTAAQANGESVMSVPQTTRITFRRP